MGMLTTHVLDTANGRPAIGVEILVYRQQEASSAERLLAQAKTNDDGRCDGPLLEGADFLRGEYRLEFHVGPYFRDRNDGDNIELFYDVIPVRFIVRSDGEHYHVPLLVSPHGYTTYRGS